MNIDKQTVKIIKNFLVKNIDPIFIYIFGSAAQGYFREDSDIDIGFITDKKFNAYDLFMLKEELADILKRDIDLVDLKEASTVFKAQVVGTGEVIYFKDENKLSDFRIRSFKEYGLLNEERKVILENIKRELKQ
ncbi:nucleotidyltransferase domain-containing protein [Crassaminicella thermophila]|uniref:Nucleotidyltransferase domain-containing protein n=1 Tax=Crassaminicella thermophila TaxID=2599308 RepID=A0A5C0SB37_CRATE|nr:nucleotidyltransferase domain-containing protein [Crassaminicella thermophila]QEK11270.1 nucleotidyltransferase domain-containing protein [Crassaminicella thermophila]